MAIFLVQVRSYVHPTDPALDEIECIKKGDIVAVFDDGHILGNSEQAPNFVVINVPGTAVQESWYRQLYRITGPNRERARKRTYSISEADVDAILAIGGETTMTESEALAILIQHTAGGP